MTTQEAYEWLERNLTGPTNAATAQQCARVCSVALANMVNHLLEEDRSDRNESEAEAAEATE